MNRLAVLSLVALGGALVLRCGQVYRGTDPLALTVVGLVGLGLLVGAVELWLRLGRAARVAGEVVALERPATEAVVEGASPFVRRWLRAACAGRSAPPTPTGFVPYLVGLLVMIGMLGTFLGLVDTMAGARAVVGDSTDIDTLRAGLAAPFAGLTRAFGTSVAGVAASAALGLAAVFVRRAEAGVRGALSEYAADPLRPLTPAGRQVATLELLATLAERSAAGAAEAAGRALEGHLVAVHAALGAAADREAARTDTLLARVDTLLSAQAERGERMEAALDTAAEARAAAARAELEATVTALGTREAERTEALVATLDAAHAERNQAALDALGAVVARAEQDAGALAELTGEARDAVVQLGAAEGARIEAAASHFESSVDQMLAGLADNAERDRGEVARLAALTAEQLERGAVQTDAVVAGIQDLAVRVAERAEGLSRQVEDAVGRQAERLTEFEAQFDASRARSREAAARRLDEHTADLARRMEAALDTAAEARAATARAELAATVAALGAREAERTETLVAALDAAHAERNQAALDALSAVRTRAEHDAGTLAELAGETRDAVVRLGAAEGARIEAAANHFESSVGRMLAGLADHAERDRGEVARLAALTAEQLEHGAVQTDAVVAGIRDLAVRVAERGSAQVEAVVGHLDMLTAGVAEREAAQIERAEGLARQVEDAVRRQAERLVEFEAQFDALRARSSEAVARRLDEHAAGLAGRLEATSGVVSEAADLLRSGGAELSAVAEMFTEAVDGYRESNERWLAALGHLESTLDSNGDGSAGAIVGEYLDQTREVFGDAMRFQRELFTELRAMRRGPS